MEITLGKLRLSVEWGLFRGVHHYYTPLTRKEIKEWQAADKWLQSVDWDEMRKRVLDHYTITG